MLLVEKDGLRQVLRYVVKKIIIGERVGIAVLQDIFQYGASGRDWLCPLVFQESS